MYIIFLQNIFHFLTKFFKLFYPIFIIIFFKISNLFFKKSESKTITIFAPFFAYFSITFLSCFLSFCFVFLTSFLVFYVILSSFFYNCYFFLFPLGLNKVFFSFLLLSMNKFMFYVIQINIFFTLFCPIFQVFFFSSYYFS